MRNVEPGAVHGAQAFWGMGCSGAVRAVAGAGDDGDKPGYAAAASDGGDAGHAGDAVQPPFAPLYSGAVLHGAGGRAGRDVTQF